MPRLTPWRWWVGHDYDGRCEEYGIDECAARDQAIKSGLRDTKPGERFHIIEARIWDRAEPAEVEPFARSRNHEIITNGPA